MCRTKHVSFNVITTPKPFKPNNVLVNVLVVVTTRSQKPKQQVLKERELVKAKGVEDWQ